MACGGKGSHRQGDSGLGGAAGGDAQSGAGEEVEARDAGLPPSQAVLWFGVAAAPGGTCSSMMSYQAPDTAQATILGASGQGARVVAGRDQLVDCSVQPSAESADHYDVRLRFQGGEIGNFVATGRLTASPAATEPNTVEVSLVTAQFSLAQQRCTADVNVIVPGAVWIRNLHCDSLRDPASPGISCAGQGGVIFENCLQ